MSLTWKSKKPRDNAVLYKGKDPARATEIDKRDEGTPDDWVPRHPDLIRLTGRHPFNVEPPLPTLMEHGFITPASLHYVRNHGAVPKLEWSSFRLSVGGLVDSPREFTMDDLLAMPAREIPVTLVCAGNRRKEENLRKQTIGFNWGAAGHACSVWKGVLVRDVLAACGVKSPDDGANHVCFLGAEYMPKGRYGTSINWFTAMDPACDVMLAYEQNGEPLTPDHGYPLRLIIPGYIGGRMIKWLTEITVTEAESDNFFHFNDNRVLPEHVTAEIANAEGWWYKPDYIINELNINSAIAYPGHQELLLVQGRDQKYTVKGYCYSGGGRKVIRVELSIDGGENWVLTKLNHPEKPTEYGKYWCWCFWELEVDVSELMMLKNAELLCRGWDAAQNRQPEKLVWNVMGMMNNSYFRVKVHRCLDPDSGKPALRFQHPTLAGPGNFGGWFEELSLGVAAPPLPPAPPKPAPPPPVPDDGVPVVLSGKSWAKLPLESRKELSDDTRLFRFALPTKEHRLGLPVGQHLFIKAKTGAGKVVMRAYTPVGDGPGYVDFVIKVYFANVHPRFPDGGAMTQAMEALKLGDTLDFKGPMGEYIFNTATSPTGSPVQLPPGLPTFTTTKNGKRVGYRKIGFISGGSGITPSLQTTVALLADKTLAVEEICILYANQKEKDILCKDILDEVEKDPRVKVWYTVDKALEPDWKYSVGFVDEAMVRDRLPAPAKDTVIFMCGPPPMIKYACIPNLEKVGHDIENCYSF